MKSAVIDIMIKTIRAIKSNCKSLLIAEENFVIKEQSDMVIERSRNPTIFLNKLVDTIKTTVFISVTAEIIVLVLQVHAMSDRKESIC